MSDVFIIRHGNTFDAGDTVTRVGARTDLPLSRSGQIQAERLASYFDRTGMHFVYAASSPLKRTRQTLDIILNQIDHPVKADILPFLTELDYGPDENRAEADVIARVGPEALRQWDECAVLPLDWRLDIPALITSWRNFFRMAQNRQGSSLIVTSNGIARFIFRALDIPRADHAIKLKTGALGHLIHDSGHWTLSEWNVRP